VPNTRGFANDYELDIHFDRHGAEFSARTKEEYLALADGFFGSPVDEFIRDFRRIRDGATIRASAKTQAIGILRSDRTIATYYSKRNRNKRRYQTIFDYARELSRT
jgi:hypothetical protein